MPYIYIKKTGGGGVAIIKKHFFENLRSEAIDRISGKFIEMCPHYLW